MANIVYWPPQGTVSGSSTITLADSSTTQAPDLLVLRHTTDQTAAAGFGATSAVELESGSGTTRRVMTDVTKLTLPTDGAEEARRDISLMVGGSLIPIASFGHFVGAATIYVGDTTHGNIFRDLASGQMQIITGGVTGMTMQTNTMTSNVRHVFAARAQISKGVSVASATTVTLGADGNVFPISGTTTIQGIVTTTWQAGSEITLMFAGILTLTHNSGAPGASAVALKLTTGANITTAANSIAVFVFDGTFWVQTCPITPGY